LDYLLLLWLSQDSSRLTFESRFKEANFQLHNLLEVPKSNPIIETAKTLVRQGKAGWIPPDVDICLPKGTKIFMNADDKVDPNAGKLFLKNTYFETTISYHVSAWRASVSSMWSGPAPSVLGMPVNPFFQKYLLKNLSSISVMAYYLVFETKLNLWLSLIRRRTFYRYMQRNEHLSDLFMRFFDLDENVKIAQASRENKIYEIVKGLDLRLGDLEKKRATNEGNKTK
jgi:hypothetical protein